MHLDSITNSTAQPAHGAMTAALKKAQQMLEESEQLLPTCKPAQDTFGHRFVLTSDINALNGEILDNSTFQTHVLCSGFPRQIRWDGIECNGAKMCIFSASLSKEHPRHPRSARKSDPHSLSNKLQTIIQLARLGKLPSQLTDVGLDIVPRSGYNIEKTMGESNYSKLRPGEVKTLVVRLSPAGDLEGPDQVDSLKRRNKSASPSGDDLSAELDRILGLPKDGVMTAKLKYKHSSLPSNTTCMTTAKCVLHTPLPPPQDRNSVDQPTASKASILVDQCLAEYYATSYEPRDALFCLNQEFGDGGCRSTCPAYVTAVADELRYQARIAERIAIQNSPQRRSKTYEAPHPGTRVEVLNAPALLSKYPKSWESISLPTRDILAPKVPPVKIAEQLGLDDARKIWNDIRKMSRGGRNENLKTPSISLAHGDQAKVVMTPMLTRDRSIGESSFRSLSMPVKTSSKRALSAPWL